MGEVSYAFESKGAKSVEVIDYRVLYLDGVRGQIFKVMSQLFRIQIAKTHTVMGYISSEHNDSLRIWRVDVALINLHVILFCRLPREPFHFVGLFTFLA